MSIEDEPKKKGGRPRKYPSDAKRPTMTFRCRTGLYGQLADRAEKTEQSISEVIEQRLIRSFEMSELYGDQDTQNLAMMVCAAARAAQARTGKPWHQEDFTRRGMSRAFRVFAALIEPRGDREPGALTEEQEAVALSEGGVIAEAAWTIVNPLLGIDPRAQEMAEALYRKKADEIEGNT